MTDQEKIQRLLRLILLLSGNKKYSGEEIAAKLGVDIRTVFRYLNTMESAGLVLDRNEGYCLLLEHRSNRMLQHLFHFTEEEAYILYGLLEQVDGNHSIKSRLVKKLHALYDFKALIQFSGESVLDRIDRLKEAIVENKQVILKAYRSSNSQTIADRKVEPFNFLPNYEGVWALDLADKLPKQFLLSRIREVELLQNAQVYKNLHQMPFADAFRMSAARAKCNVHLHLTLKARNLLQEEFPLAMEYLKETSKGYELDIPVAHYDGIARFVMGLPEDVKILKPKGFKDFVRQRINVWMSDGS